LYRYAEARRFTPEEWEAETASRTAAKTTGAVAVAALAAAAGAMVDEGKGVRERMAESQRLLRERWGLFKCVCFTTKIHKLNPVDHSLKAPGFNP
jgi:hypothetical protein